MLLQTVDEYLLVLEKSLEKSNTTGTLSVSSHVHQTVTMRLYPFFTGYALANSIFVRDKRHGSLWPGLRGEGPFL